MQDGVEDGGTGTVREHAAGDHALRAGRRRAGRALARGGTATLLRARRRRVSMSAGAASAGGARQPVARHQDRPDRHPAGDPHPGRAHHRGRTGGAGQDSRRRAGDRSRPGHRAARPDRRAHPHVQPAQARHVAGDLDADRHPQSAGRPARRLHHGARHELARQRLRRRRHPQRHQRRPHRRPALSGLGTRHRLGRRDAGLGRAPIR